MRKFSYYVFGLSIFILLVSVAGFILNERVLETEMIFASVNVTGTSGFDVNETALTFGNIPNPGTSTRHVFLENEYDFPIIATIDTEGDIKNYLKHDGFVRIEPGEKKKIPISAVSYDYGDYGFHSGNVKFEIKPA